MKIISLVLYAVAIIFCVLGFIGHQGAWSVAALCFFAGIMTIVGRETKKKDKH